MDIFDKVTALTDDLNTIVEIVCPEIRPSVYYLEQIFSPEWQYNPDYATKFLASVDKKKLIELYRLLSQLTTMINLPPTYSIESIIKFVLEFSYSFTFGKSISKIVKNIFSFFSSKSKQNSEQDKIFDIGESILKTCNSITESKTHSELSKLLRDKSMVRPIAFSILCIFKIVECKLVKTNLTDLEIVSLCLLYWSAIMRYHLNNMNETVWLPMITSLFARNGGRFFRLCKIAPLQGVETLPLYKTLFPKGDLSHAVKPNWQDQLYSSLKRSELMSTNKALHKLFLFHIIDQFLTVGVNSVNKDISIENLYGMLRPYPNYNTLQRYFMLYLDKPIYTDKIDCSSWEPDKLLYKLFMLHYPDYNDCIDAMREEYFPQSMFDLGSLVSAACEFYDDKLHLDMYLNKVSDFTMLDNFSIWLTAEWIIKNRSYPFLNEITVVGLAEMIGSTITGSTS